MLDALELTFVPPFFAPEEPHLVQEFLFFLPKVQPARQKYAGSRSLIDRSLREQ